MASAMGPSQKFQSVSPAWQGGLGAVVVTQVPSPGYIQVQMRCILADQSTVFYSS